MMMMIIIIIIVIRYFEFGLIRYALFYGCKKAIGELLGVSTNRIGIEKIVIIS